MTPPDRSWRQIDLARAIAQNQGLDPDQPVLRRHESGKHSVLPAWQHYWTLAGAVIEVLETRPIALP